MRQLRGEHARVTVGGDHADAPHVLHAHHVPEPVAAQHKPHVDVGRHRVSAHFGHRDARAGAVPIDRRWMSVGFVTECHTMCEVVASAGS